MITAALPDNPIERIRHNLVGLRMPRALEALEAVIQQLERGQLGAIEAIDTLLAEEITVREGRRIKAALQMARLATIRTLTGFDFSFQPSLDRNRIMALASLDFVDKHEVVHFIGQSGTGKSHLAVALGVEAIRAGRSVYFCPLADIIDSLAKADREGRLRERIRYLCRTQLLIIDEIGYVTLGAAAGNLFFQLVNIRSTKGEDESRRPPMCSCHSGTPRTGGTVGPRGGSQAASRRSARGRRGQRRLASADRRAEHGARGWPIVNAHSSLHAGSPPRPAGRDQRLPGSGWARRWRRERVLRTARRCGPRSRRGRISRS
jgi:DNA replication protein DnaC